MKKILITGSSGLLGNAIKLLENNYNNYEFIYINSKICNLIDYTQTLNFFNNIKPDIVIHLAACVGGLFKNISEKVKMFEENIIINTNVIKASSECNVKRLIACLSTCVFPDDLNIKSLDETMLHNGPPHPSNEGYAYAKRMLEVHCRLYSENFLDRKYFCIIPTNIYGPFDNFNLEDGHVIPSLIHKCYIAKNELTEFEVKGSGKPLRHFIYSKDIAKLIFLLLEKEDFNENIILSPNEEYSIEYVANLINNHFNNKIVFNSKYSDGQFRKTTNNNKLNNLLNFKFTDLKDGIEETIQWFIENYDTLRK